MTTFLTPTDIANRGLQYCGASRIVSLTEDSKNANAVAFVYDKLRQAELRRAVWKFSVRKAVLRAIDADTRAPVIPLWAAGSYVVGKIVSYLSALWVAVEDTSAIPGSDGGQAWATYAGPMTVAKHDADTTYDVGELVYVDGAPNVVYMSTTSGNEDTPPTGAWLVTGLTTKTMTILEPAEGYGRFLFRLPANYLRFAPNPKDGAYGVLGGPSGYAYQDQNFEGKFITQTDPYPFLMRFAADIVDVPSMDPLFCEGLASRIGIAVCEELTQSSAKLGTIASQYKTFMGEARIVNAIEVGPQEPAEDDYITVRR